MLNKFFRWLRRTEAERLIDQKMKIERRLKEIAAQDQAWLRKETQKNIFAKARKLKTIR